MTTPPERRPAIVAVDDEPAVLAAVARDLRRGFGEHYRIVRAGSGPEALELVRPIPARGEPGAVLIGDQGVPGMAGARRAGGDADRRSADARDAGDGVPGGGAQARAGRQARAADRLRRHAGG